MFTTEYVGLNTNSYHS